MNTSRFLSALLLVAGWALAGCDEGPTIQVRYQRPAQWDIPSSIVKLGIAEFTGQTHEDKEWGDIASDKFASELDAYNRQYQRYQLVDRKRLGQIMAERDLQMAISDPSTASRLGKLADVDGILYGSVHVSSHDDRGTKTVPDLVHRTIKSVSYTKRYCQVTVNFTLDAVQTGRTLASATLTEEYDSEKDKKSGGAGIAKALGFSGDALPAPDEIYNALIDRCVRQFMTKISPHVVSFEEKLQGGKGDAIQNGNAFAEAGEYADALRVYEQGLQATPGDDGLLFNAGVMCEALGQLQRAVQYYDKAIAAKAKVDKKYVAARARVRGGLGS